MGNPLKVKLIGGQVSDVAVAPELIVEQKSVACIKPRRNRKVVIPFDKVQYKERHMVECFFQKLKRYRRIVTRYEKLAKRFLALIHVACILIWLL